SRNGIFPLVGTGGPAPCRSGVPRPMIFYGRELNVHISFNVNKRRASFDNGKSTGYKLVSDYVDNRHFRLSFSQSAVIVLLQLRIGMDRTDSGQVQHGLKPLVGYRTDLGLPLHTRSGLMVERRNAGEARKLTPGIKA